MSLSILFSAIIIFFSIVINRFSSKIGLPSLVFFMLLGMILRPKVFLNFTFNNYDLIVKICLICLLFIIFYGGFCTKKVVDNRISIQAFLLSSLGTILTAIFCTAFCFYYFKLSFIESFLISSVISSTDAASVFFILRSRKLNLKYDTTPMLEMESGSNDPFAYILLILALTFFKESSLQFFLLVFLKQVLGGVLIGFLVAFFALFIIKKTKLLTEGVDSIFIISVVLFSFSLADYLQGNGFLSVYITGFVLGNSDIKNKISLTCFFDSVIALCQITIFFLIGFLSYPHKILEVLNVAVLIAIFLTFFARPLAVLITLSPFKMNWNQLVLISSAGLRGASSIVFALLVVSENVFLFNDLFHVVFVIVLLSISFQGTLLPIIAKKIDMIDRFTDVRKSFNDFQQESAIALNKIFIHETHPWVSLQIKDIKFSDNALILVITRDGKSFIPKGNSKILKYDQVLVGTTFAESDVNMNFCETHIDNEHEWLNLMIKDICLPDSYMIALIKRNGEFFVPDGFTKIKLRDTIIFYYM